MIRDDIVSNARSLLDDQIPDGDGNYLWSTTELELFTDVAYQDALARVGGELNTVDMDVAVTTGNAVYAMDASILHVIRAKLDGQQMPLNKRTIALMDDLRTGWEESTGTPTDYIDALDRHYIRLYPIPVEDSTLKLTVNKLANTPLDGSLTLLPEHLHYGLVYLVCELAYRKHDEDTANDQKAIYYEGLSERFFGPRRSANAQEFERNFTIKKVRPAYFA